MLKVFTNSSIYFHVMFLKLRLNIVQAMICKKDSSYQLWWRKILSDCENKASIKIWWLETDMEKNLGMYIQKLQMEAGKLMGWLFNVSLAR